MTMPDQLAEKVIVADNHIVIRDGYYEIPLDDCNTPEKLISWVIYLLEKKWINQSIIYRFVKTACKENNLKIPY
ncbi:hypothetical protein L4D76_10770 [Photobacterium sagamiensis]|uniref:hypothetical protein n=1 Tax=Photobacterium sagamiensis TaxID=2910241 RepID=UPI003D10D7F0